MQTTTKWILGGTAALAISGLLYVLPVSASGNSHAMVGGNAEHGPGMMGSGMMGHATLNGDMAAMHNLMTPLMSQMPAMHNEVMGQVASRLGTTTDQLFKAMGEGKSLAQIAQEQNVSAEDLQAVKIEGMKTFVDRLVTAKSLTKEQADQFLTSMEKNMGDCLTGGMSDMMGHGMMGGGKHGH